MLYILTLLKYGPLAQLVEHLPFKEGVDGSSPSGLTNQWFLINS